MAVLGAVVLAASATLAYREWSRLASVHEAGALLHVIGAANRFIEAMALERGVYNQVIVSTEMPVPAKQHLVAERVSATNAVFDETLGNLALLTSAEARRALAPVREARGLLNAARSRGDEAALGGQIDRNAASKSLLAEFVKAGLVLDGAMIRLQAAVASRDPRLGSMIAVSRLSNGVREAAGERSTILSRYVGTRIQLDTDNVLRVAELTGVIRSTWDRLTRIVGQIEDSPKLDAAIQKTTETFWKLGEPIYQQAAKAARTGAEAPMPFMQWRAWTVSMLKNTLFARDAPVEQALSDVEVMRTSALRRLFFVSGVGIASMFTFLGAAFFVERRVIQPLGWITAALDRSALPGVQPVPSRALKEYSARRDELGALYRALQRSQAGGVALQHLHERFDAAITNLPQGLCVLDRDLRLVICNRQYAELYGLDPAQTTPGTPLEAILRCRAVTGYAPSDFENYVEKTIERARSSEPTKFVVELRNSRVVEVTSRRLPDGGCLATHDDITSRRLAEAQIAHLANHDALTGLPNRALLNERMKEALARVGRGEQAALLYLDLDNFKAVNDLLGHPCGDALLRAVSERIRDCARAMDTVARLGGDEFAVLQVGSDQPRAANELARRILQAFEAPYQLDGHELHAATSIGVAVLRSGDSLIHLFKCADLALYRAKAEGRGVVRFFEEEMDAKMQQRRMLESDLRKALNAGEFVVFFQPIVDLRDGKLQAFEALIRWNRPGHGLVAPAEFISVAEEIGAIIPMGEWVLTEACRQAMTWPEEVSLCVNLSPVQFRSRSLLETVDSALKISGLSASRLELEITESVLLKEDERNLATLHELRANGVRIALDDFGTGFSSLSYLRRFPFHKVKIDKSFVRELPSSSECAAIVRAVVGLARALGMRTTAEGVETHGQLHRLQQEGCLEAQGFLFGKPMVSSDLAEFIAGSCGTEPATAGLLPAA